MQNAFFYLYLINAFSNLVALSEKLGELAAGARRFDEEGVQQLVSLANRFGKLARSFVTTKDELSALSRNYRIFTCAPEEPSLR